MSGYKAGEALWQTRIQAISGIDGNQVTRGKWGVLNSGHANTYIILKPGTHGREMIGLNRRLDVWQTVIQVWRRYTDDGDSMTDLENTIDTILAALDPRRLMGDTAGTIQDAQIIEVREMVQTPADAPKWLYVELIGEWREETTISYAE